MQLVKVKLVGSGDIVELIPAVAYARIGFKTAELVHDPNLPSAAAAPIETTESPKATDAERAVAPAQKPKSKR